MQRFGEFLRSAFGYITTFYKIAKWSLIGFFLITFLMVLMLRWIDPPFSAFMVQKRISAWWNDQKGYKVNYRWVNWRRISRHAPLAVMASEDQKFPFHWGFDTESIAKAWLERVKGIRHRGASTITQQVAKNLFLWPGKNMFRKGVEAYFTALIELLWPKKRILEIYLNVAEFGRGVFGVRTASHRFFKKPPARLSRGECALLAAVLPNPIRMRVEKPSEYVIKHANWIYKEMDRLDRIQKKSYLSNL